MSLLRAAQPLGCQDLYNRVRVEVGERYGGPGGPRPPQPSEDVSLVTMLKMMAFARKHQIPGLFNWTAYRIIANPAVWPTSGPAPANLEHTVMKVLYAARVWLQGEWRGRRLVGVSAGMERRG
ncbi:hypothetical protein L227DRAFT_578915 [Lentinus tigrinus ALCF2SS1-6]|uniref:Uncharacterized protein n=1 Tax=Lentinus tigrinus ALCF2SS1-6 TaxID=1328759 RepID=A0A5C2RZF1_9APHY|nr:hypothetical protein L227DRAFT_578915 [Lentinus tigrinus ALCF2SS1-6]